MNKALEYFIAKTQSSEIAISDFVREALFNDNFGYYKKAKKRVGKSGDFYTSSSLNPELFSSLLKEAFCNIAKPNFKNDNFEFCEIGAEPELNLFENSKVIRGGERLELKGNLFVFSNELLDAQPFDRFIFKGGEFFKLYCKFLPDGGVEKTLKKASVFETEILCKYFDNLEDGFVLDFSFDALNLLREICNFNWRGVIIFADYFRTKEEILNFENGTARSYFKHRITSDIFSDIGERDITFSPVVEPFLDILKDFGFSSINCTSQGNFFIQNSQSEIKKVIENSGVFSAQKRAMSEILTPQYMGEAFKVLSAVRA